MQCRAHTMFLGWSIGELDYCLGYGSFGSGVGQFWDGWFGHLVCSSVVGFGFLLYLGCNLDSGTVGALGYFSYLGALWSVLDLGDNIWVILL